MFSPSPVVSFSFLFCNHTLPDVSCWVSCPLFLLPLSATLVSSHQNFASSLKNTRAVVDEKKRVNKYHLITTVAPLDTSSRCTTPSQRILHISPSEELRFARSSLGERYQARPHAPNSPETAAKMTKKSKPKAYKPRRDEAPVSGCGHTSFSRAILSF